MNYLIYDRSVISVVFWFFCRIKCPMLFPRRFINQITYEDSLTRIPKTARSSEYKDDILVLSNSLFFYESKSISKNFFWAYDIWNVLGSLSRLIVVWHKPQVARFMTGTCSSLKTNDQGAGGAKNQKIGKHWLADIILSLNNWHDKIVRI